MRLSCDCFFDIGATQTNFTLFLGAFVSWWFNRPRMKFAICNEIFKDWKLEDAMTFAKKAGYDAIEIAPFTIANDVREISDETRKEIRQSAKEIGIEISGIHWVLVQTEGL